LHALLFIVTDTRDGEAEAIELLGICREYLTGILLETTRKEEKDGKRAAALAAYFSHCKLQPKHIVFVLRTAMKESHFFFRSFFFVFVLMHNHSGFS
jgi:coatomer protein complex subunit alpha (xenin)